MIMANTDQQNFDIFLFGNKDLKKKLATSF
jgi:hypothetical protein